jgi:hypothetical protein
MIKAEGRDPADVGIEIFTSPGQGTEEDWRREFSFWKKAGVTHICAHTTYESPHNKRLASTHYDDHLKAITHYRKVVEDLL